ncbi:MAG: hypothetical protein LBD48_01220 [Treponema sp.]|jgi:hypothetical protein|nr:hypothetical protein [Treponema sp.]
MSGLDRLKDRAFFGGWIAGLVIIGALVWSLTQPLRTNHMLRAVNKMFAVSGDQRRLAAPRPGLSAGTLPLGRWYSFLESKSLLLVFTIMRDGILVPCGAQVSPEGIVEEIIPLGVHARQVFDRLPNGLVQIYVSRIESLAALELDAAETGSGR